MKAISVHVGIGFPYAAQAVQVEHRRRGLSGHWHTETTYPVTSLAAHQAGPADHGHWHTKNRLHWARDVAFDEDRAQIRTSNHPQIMASLRNLAITVLHLTGVTNVAAALHHQARRPDRLLHTLTTC